MNHTPPLSFMSANLVAQPWGFHLTRGWGQGDSATQDLFRSPERFAERFEDLVTRVRSLGFAHLDLWCAHLHPDWATVRHLAAARRILDANDLQVTSYLWYGGTTVEDLRLAAAVMQALGTDLISGHHGLLDSDRPALAAALRDLGLRLAYENHPERSAGEVLARVGEADPDVLGVALDTGWAGTRAFDAREALAALCPRLFHLHAKDVRAPRSEKTGFDLIDNGHETCVLGDGIVPVDAVIRDAVAAGFRGPIGIEHEPEDHDPFEECRISLQRVQSWIA